MTRELLLVAPLALSSCGGNGDDSANLGCGVQLSSNASFPVNNAQDAYYRAPVEWYLTGVDATAAATLSDASGNPIDGTSSVDPETGTVRFQPSQPLTPSTGYSASLSWCAGNETISFQTSELGLATDAASLAGRTYELRLKGGRFTKPAGVMDMLMGSLTRSILIAVTDVQPDESITMMGAVSEDAVTTQDHCAPTFDFPTADFSTAPYFSAGPVDITLDVAGAPMQISHAVVSGTFSPDGSYFGGTEISGELDARVLAPNLTSLLGEGANGDSVCAFFATLQADCVPCSTDSQTYCIEVLADSINAPQIPDQSLDEVLLANCDPQCETIAEDCDTSGW
jgi:hypothetical protein